MAHPFGECSHSGLYLGTFCANTTSSIGFSSPTFCFACLITSTFCCALAIISSTSGIFMATVGLIVALMTLIRIGRLTSSVRFAMLSSASAACLCANACSLHMFPMHFLITFTFSFILPTSSSSTNSKTSCSFRFITSDAICGPISVSSTNVAGSTAVFPFNFNRQALHLASGTLAKTSTGSAPFSIVRFHRPEHALYNFAIFFQNVGRSTFYQSFKIKHNLPQVSLVVFRSLHIDTMGAFLLKMKTLWNVVWVVFFLRACNVPYFH